MTTDTSPSTGRPSGDRGTSDPQHDLKSLPIPQVQEQLHTSAAGLSQDEAARRLARYGPNEIVEHTAT